jgi:hypothetical protein
VKARVVETLGAGRTATSPKAAAPTSAPAAKRGRHGTPSVSDTDCHKATSPHTPHPTHARTQAPSARSTDWEAATAIRAVEPASEYVTSRRAGTSNAWVDSTQANSTASGASTVAMSPGLAVRVTVRMNHTKPPTAQSARIGLIPGHGSDLRRYETMLPSTVAAAANRDTAGLSSPSDQQAPIPIRTAITEAARKEIECSGGPGRLTSTNRSHNVMPRPS